HVLLDEGRRLLFLVAADLADEDDQLGLRVGLEAPKHVDERRSRDGIAPDPDDGRVAEPELGELVADLVGQRPGAGDEADRPFAEDLARDDPDVRLSRGEHARAVRADHGHAFAPDIRVGQEHVVRRDVLGDADQGADAGVDRFVDRVRRESGRDEDKRGVRARFRDRVGDGVEYRDPFDVLAALARRYAGDDVRPVVAVPQAVEAPLAAGQALHDQTRVFVDDDRHYFWLRRAFRRIDSKA